MAGGQRVTTKPTIIETQFDYVNVRIIGDRVAICIGFKKATDGAAIASIGTLTWHKAYDDTTGKTLFRIMQVADVTSLDRVAGRRVRVVVQDGIPIELINPVYSKLRWELP